MGAWDTYLSRIGLRGDNKRQAQIVHQHRFLNSKMPSSLSYHTLLLDGVERQIAVINSDNLDQKTICTMPGEDLTHGGYVEWMDNHWLITEKDANNELYTRGIMKQCNYLLKWITEAGEIVERWCIVTDGTKYLTGEWGDNNFIITRGDSRISVIIARDRYTLQFNRENRFLIDDYDSKSVLAYRLTKPFKLGGSFNGSGVLNLVMQECNTEDTDNFDLHIANYYKFFPKESVCGDDSCPLECVDAKVDNHGKKVLL